MSKANAVEMTDQEIRAALIRHLRWEFSKKDSATKPYLGCKCHPLSPQEVLDCLDKMELEEKLEEGPAHAMETLLDPKRMRDLAHEFGEDPVAWLDDQAEIEKTQGLQGAIERAIYRELRSTDEALSIEALIGKLESEFEEPLVRLTITGLLAWSDDLVLTSDRILKLK